MARTPKAVPATDGGRLAPRYPMGPTTLEITVALLVQDAQIMAWDGRSVPLATPAVIEDAGGIDLDQAKTLLVKREIASASLPPEERGVLVRGSVELTRHALPRAHRALVLLVEDQILPDFLQHGWVAGKIGVPKGSPAVRQVNLHRHGE